MEEVRVRFAPSPTGFLHVGGARTAIFNWLFAKNQGGKFLLRIEDTDPLRSKSELTEQIIRSLNWLEMQSDEPIVYQADRILLYKKIVETLVQSGKAYYSFMTAEELEQMRKTAIENKTSFKYDRENINLSVEEINKKIYECGEYAIRFLVPNGETVLDDMVHGETKFSNSELDDFVIQRSDGSPVYQIAVVVDDHEMNITHIIRGDDHLSNTPKQILLYKALGWELPQFAHLPLILDEEKKKLSKRRNPVAVEEYRDKGYLPEAFFNFLTLLGFAPENNVEIISREELKKIFTFDRVNKKSAVFDMKKLNWINCEYIKMKDEKEVAQLIRNLIPGGEKFSDDHIIKVVHILKERANTLHDFIERGYYFFTEPVTYEEKGAAKFLNDDNKKLLKEYLNSFKSAFENNSSPSHSEYETNLRSFTEIKGIKAASVIHPLRLALTGGTVSPGIFEVMEVIGTEKITDRINKFLSK